MKYEHTISPSKQLTWRAFFTVASFVLVMSKAEGVSVLENYLATTGKSLAAYEKCMERLGAEEYEPYKIAWSELEGGNIQLGLWAKLYSENDGDTNKTKASYIKERVRQLQSEISDSLSKDAQKMICITEYEQKFANTNYPQKYTDVDIEGTGGYRGTGESTYFKATITNNSNDLIITRVEWTISHYDNKTSTGSQASDKCESGKGAFDLPLWIEPNGGKDRVVCDVKFIPEKNRHGREFNTWSINAIYGLELN